MRTGFVILSGDEEALLARSLPAAMAEGFDEALVIDNASRSGATAELAAACGAAVIRLPHRVPYTEAMNAALERMSADAIALLQADTFLTAGYLGACVAALGDPGVAVVAPKLLRTDGAGSPEGRREQIDAAAMTFDRRRKNRLVGHGRPASEYPVAAGVFGADGAAAMYRRTALEDCAIDGRVFDENMPGWGCDADLAWRAQLLGWRARYEPSAIVHHIRTYSPSTRARMPAADRRTQFRNRLLMIAKNDAPRDLLRDAGPLLLYEVLALGYALVREPELLGGYVEAARRLPEALRQRRVIQARRRVARVPFGLLPPVR
ncbi:MAG: glycosyltransferase family 2 protein [Solirubrobacteraceae bacterium]